MFGLKNDSKAATPFLNNALGTITTRFDEFLLAGWLPAQTARNEETRVGVKTGRVFCFLDKN